MTRTEQAEKLLTMIKGVADSTSNERISGMIDKYFKEIYNFRTRNIDVITIPVGQIPKHSHFNPAAEEEIYCVQEFTISGHSARQVLDKLHTILDKLDFVAYGRMLVGIRQNSIDAVNYTHPDYYFANYSVSCLDKEGNCWSIDLPSMQAVIIKKYETTKSKGKTLGDLGITLNKNSVPASSNRVGTGV